MAKNQMEEQQKSKEQHARQWNSRNGDDSTMWENKQIRETKKKTKTNGEKKADTRKKLTQWLEMKKRKKKC